MNLVQKTDLAAASFANNNTAGAGGISIRVDNGSTVKTAIDAAVAALGVGVTLTDTAPSTSSTTAATPNFVNAAIAAAGAGGSVTLTNTAPSTSSTTAATPAFVNAAIATAVPAASTSTAGVVTLTNTAPSTSATTAATPAFVNAAITAAAAGGGVVIATDTEIRNGTAGNKVVTADVLMTALNGGLNYKGKFVAGDTQPTLTARNTSATAGTAVHAIHAETTAATGDCIVINARQESTAASIVSMAVGGYNASHGAGVSGISRGVGVYGELIVSGVSSSPLPAGVVGIVSSNAQNAAGVHGVAGLTAGSTGSNTPAIQATAGGNGSRTGAIEAYVGGANTTWGVYTNGAMTATAFTVSSDERLKTEITGVDGARALAFAKAVKFWSYIKHADPVAAQAVADAESAHDDSESQRTRSKIAFLSIAAANGDKAAEARVAELGKELAEHAERSAKRKGKKAEPQVLGKEIGVIAQEVKALTDKEFPEFAFLVKLSDPTNPDSMLTVDMNGLQNIVLAGLQHLLFA